MQMNGVDDEDDEYEEDEEGENEEEAGTENGKEEEEEETETENDEDEEDDDYGFWYWYDVGHRHFPQSFLSLQPATWDAGLLIMISFMAWIRHRTSEQRPLVV